MALTKKELQMAVRLLKATNAANKKQESIKMFLEVRPSRIDLIQFDVQGNQVVNFEGTGYWRLEYYADSHQHSNSKWSRGEDHRVSSIDELIKLVETGEIPSHLK